MRSPLRAGLLPMVVALPLFLQNLETTNIGTALPSMARSLGADPLQLKLAITAYLLSLAIFLPASGWLADRFGARRVFRWAIVVFALGSLGCAASPSVPALVAARVLQGMGGAMMVPVGRLILLRSVPGSAMVTAMIWFTIPPAMGRVIGPLVGGAVVTWTSWRWIFVVTLAASLCALALASAVIDDDSAATQPARSFDAIGFGLLGFGLAALLGGLEAAGSHGVPDPVWIVACTAGAASLLGYYAHYRRVDAPLIDLGILRYRTLSTMLLGAFPLRMATGAVPFVLPLMFQLAFGMDALTAGLLVMCNALGALSTRAIMRSAIERSGFKPVLVGSCVGTGLCYLGYGLLTASTPAPMLVVLMFAGGIFNALVVVLLQTLGYTEVPPPQMAQATAFATMLQQLSLSVGVLFAAELLRAAAAWNDRPPAQLATGDFALCLFVLAAGILATAVSLARLPRDVGAGLK